MSRIEIKYKTTYADIECFMRRWSATGQPWEESVRQQQRYLADHPANMSITLMDRAGAEPIAVGAAIFAREEFYKFCVASATPYVMEHAMDWASRGLEPFLSPKEVKALNRRHGLIMMVTTYGLWPEGTWTRGELFQHLLGKHIEAYEGYNVKKCFGEPMVDMFLEHMLRQGYRMVNAYPDFHGNHGSVRPPALLEIDRDVALAGHDYYLCRLFSYREPRCGFTIGQQELLIEARKGGTDDDIAEELCISRNTIKQRWAGVYARIDDVIPGYLPEAVEGRRSKERRRLTIQFVNEHPYELRP